MFRTDILRRSSGFRIDGPGEDWDLFLRMTEISRVANLDEILYLYRVHRKSTTVLNARRVGLRYAHACECARLRSAHGQETSFEDYCDRQKQRPFWRRWIAELDAYSLACYREGLNRIVNENPLSGHLRIILAAILSPERLMQRIRRAMRTVK
jgi:hypothetical protein